MNVIGILNLARDRTENRRPLFLIARLPTLTRGRRGKLVKFGREGSLEVVCSRSFPVALSSAREVRL